VAASLANNSRVLSDRPNEARAGIATAMMRFCRIQRPVRVTIRNKMNSRRTSVSEVLKVYFLFIEKLNRNATEVEIMFATTTGTPNTRLSKKRIPKSMTVLMTPIAPKRMILLFFSESIMILVDQIEWSILTFVKYTPHILADYPEAEKLYATKEQNCRHSR